MDIILDIILHLKYENIFVKAFKRIVIQKLYRFENKDTLTEVYRTVLLVIERQDKCSGEIIL